ncbi:MAG: FGGY-family carbohydrate kinase [Clostridia bacterium]|nr:FGGY-family carbohydrate kinase [Clostridia bacterium]
MIAGIDLGTSSVKVLVTDNGKTVKKAKRTYTERSVDAWLKAVSEALSEISRGIKIDAVSLSSQVGTYIINGSDIISWQDPIGREEVARIKKDISKEEFAAEISMPHPEVISYPMPRLLYIKEHYDAKSVCQPKDKICQMLTGKQVSDIYSWRGLANLETGAYSKKMLSYLGVDESILPPLKSPFDLAGYVTKEASEKTGLLEGTPVYLGCNDYYAGLLGMGIVESDMLFDITGTSEHIGITTDKLSLDTKMVTGPYFVSNVHYGVTASGGTSLDFGIEKFGFEGIDVEKSLSNDAPIFLPYLKGERAPIWDSNARGMFFGISDKTTKEDMAYSVLEGVAFSAYHIYESLEDNVDAKYIITAGGAGKDEKFNKIKSSLWNLPVVTLEETDTSAYGACMIASVASGIYKDIKEAAKAMCRIEKRVEAKENPLLRQRFELYKKLYESNKQNFEEFRRLAK